MEEGGEMQRAERDDESAAIERFQKILKNGKMRPT